MNSRVVCRLLSIYAILNLLFFASCGTIEEISPSPYKTGFCETMIEGFGARCFACDESFLNRVFAKGEAGYNLAIKNIDLISKSQVASGSQRQRELYLWLTALSTFYWPSIYNSDDIDNDRGLKIENVYREMLRSGQPAIVEACLGMLFLHENIVSKKLIGEIMEHCASKEKNIAELANAYCNRFFFVRVVDPGEEIFPGLEFSNVGNASLGGYVKYWRNPGLYSRSSCVKTTIGILAGNADMAGLSIKSRDLLTTKDYKGGTPLHHAVRRKISNPWVILILNAAKDKKKLVLEEDNDGYNVFHRACERDNIDFVKYCLENKIVDANTVNSKNGRTALHIACYNGFTKLVDLLLKHKAKVNIKTTAGHTALHAACAWGYGTKEIVEALIKANVDINAIDNSGKTALDYATRIKDRNVFRILRQKGAKLAKELGTRVSPSRKTKPPVATGAEREGERGSTRENAGKSLNQSERD